MVIGVFPLSISGVKIFQKNLIKFRGARKEKLDPVRIISITLNLDFTFDFVTVTFVKRMRKL